MFASLVQGGSRKALQSVSSKIICNRGNVPLQCFLAGGRKYNALATSSNRTLPNAQIGEAYPGKLLRRWSSPRWGSERAPGRSLDERGSRRAGKHEVQPSSCDVHAQPSPTVLTFAFHGGRLPIDSPGARRSRGSAALNPSCDGHLSPRCGRATSTAKRTPTASSNTLRYRSPVSSARALGQMTPRHDREARTPTEPRKETGKGSWQGLVRPSSNAGNRFASTLNTTVSNRANINSFN